MEGEVRQVKVEVEEEERRFQIVTPNATSTCILELHMYTDTYSKHMYIHKYNGVTYVYTAHILPHHHIILNICMYYSVSSCIFCDVYWYRL